jgi:Flp pilus assembly protein TadG
MKLWNKLVTDDRGAVLPVVAVFIAVVFFGLAALVVDAGLLYNQRRQMISAADAGALAGANEIIIQSRKGKTISQIEVLAAQTARDVAILNGADSASLQVIADADSINAYGYPFVEVKTTKNTKLVFAGAFNKDNSDVRARAVARAEKRLNPGMMPLLVLDGYKVNQLAVLHEPTLTISDSILNYSSSILDLDGDRGGGTNELQAILNREIQLSQATIEQMTLGLATMEGGFKDFGSSFETWFASAVKNSADPLERKAYMTVFIPVIADTPENAELKPNQTVNIIRFTEFVMVDYIDKPNGKNGGGLLNAFDSDYRSINVDYSKVDGISVDSSHYMDGLAKEQKLIVGYFTGKDISLQNIRDHYFEGTIYEKNSKRRFYLVQ